MPTKDQLQAFYQNPLIKRLSTKPQWTISENKAPRNIKYALETNFKPIDLHQAYQADHNIYKKYLFSYANQGILPLTKFDQQVPTTITNRTFRFNMPTCHVLGLDIEPQYNHDRWDKWLQWAPIDYIEYSTHHGYHVLINIPDEVYQDPVLTKFLTDNTDIQFLEKDKSHQGIEFVLNKHFMNLTRNVLTNQNDWPYIPYQVPNPKAKTVWLRQFLKYIQKIHQQTTAVDLKAVNLPKLTPEKQEQIDIIKDYLTPEQIKHAKLTATHYQNAEQNQLDLSRVEWRFLSSIYGYYRQITKQPANINALQQQLRLTKANDVAKLIDNPQMAALVITDLAQHHLTPRKKWSTKRHNIPWLLSNAIKVVDYIDHH